MERGAHRYGALGRNRTPRTPCVPAMPPGKAGFISQGEVFEVAGWGEEKSNTRPRTCGSASGMAHTKDCQDNLNSLAQCSQKRQCLVLAHPHPTFRAHLLGQVRVHILPRQLCHQCFVQPQEAGRKIRRPPRVPDHLRTMRKARPHVPNPSNCGKRSLREVVFNKVHQILTFLCWWANISGSFHMLASVFKDKRRTTKSLRSGVK